LEEGGKKLDFILSDLVDESLDFCHHISPDKLMESTIQFWHNWLSQCTYRGIFLVLPLKITSSGLSTKGRWREMVHRSALVMKLLTFEPTGAIVAAPTCSLPEGG